MKSAPIVARYEGKKVLERKWFRIDVLPHPPSPMSTILSVRLGKMRCRDVSEEEMDESVRMDPMAATADDCRIDAALPPDCKRSSAAGLVGLTADDAACIEATVRFGDVVDVEATSRRLTV